MRRIVVAGVASIALFALAACSSNDPASSSEATAAPVASASSPSNTSSATPDPLDKALAEGKYTQTWKAHYDVTSCHAYQQVMTPHERWVAAADMLSAARTGSGINEVLPPDPLVDGFAEGIDMVCTANPKFTIALAAAGLYTDDRRFQQ